MLLAILGGVSASTTFDRDGSVNRTKGYLTFILAFTAITNSMVCFLYLIIQLCDFDGETF